MPKYIRVTNEPVSETRELLAGELLADVDQGGRLVGVEILSDDDKHPEAHLRHAWSWDCEHCGIENFERSITRDLTEEEAETPYENLEYAVFGHPRIVKCCECGAMFTAKAGDEIE